MRKRIGVAAIVSAMIAVSAPATAQQNNSTLTFASRESGSERFELTLSGTGVPSRDAVEGELLRRAALFTRSRGYDWFVLLHMAGEQPGQHPPRTDPAFGARYGHWQPHWTYKIGEAVWQPWHPEWGAPFWTKEVDAAGVQAFEAHAMIEVGRGTLPSREAAFDAKQIIGDLLAAPRNVTNSRERASSTIAPAQRSGCR